MTPKDRNKRRSGHLVCKVPRVQVFALWTKQNLDSLEGTCLSVSCPWKLARI